MMNCKYLVVVYSVFTLDDECFFLVKSFISSLFRPKRSRIWELRTLLKILHWLEFWHFGLYQNRYWWVAVVSHTATQNSYQTFCWISYKSCKFKYFDWLALETLHKCWQVVVNNAKKRHTKIEFTKNPLEGRMQSFVNYY